MIIFSRLKNFFSKISSGVLKNKKRIFVIVASLILMGLVFIIVPQIIFAQAVPPRSEVTPAPTASGSGGDTSSDGGGGNLTVVQEKVYEFMSIIFGLFLSFFAEVLLILVKFVVRVSTYNDFANSTAVVTGWVIVRDLVNMFFVVVLLVIAIATILKIESYSYKKMLGRLVLMAVLVNFSKTISLLIIDFAQVIMMTFVNGFQAAAGGNFVQALGLSSITSIARGEVHITAWEIAIAYMLGLVMVAISCVVVGMMLIILVMRMVVLWILIVLSPLAFFLSIIPQAQKYANQWWSQFTEYVLVGPILAFFLWLSLISVTTLSEADQPRVLTGETKDTGQRIAISAIGDEQSVLAFIIAIGMLIAGLTMTGKMGVIGAGIGVGALAFGKKMGMKMGMGAVKWGAGKGKKAGSWMGSQLYSRTGVELRPSKRKEAREARRESLEKQREARGKAIAAERVEEGGGAAKILTALGDPRLISKMSRWEMAKATFSKGGGGIEARRKMERGASSQYAAAIHEMRLQDPYGAHVKDEEKKQRSQERDLKGREQEIKDLKLQHGEKITDFNDLQEQQESIDQSIEEEKKGEETTQRDIEKNEQEERNIELSINRRGEIDKELTKITVALSDLEKRLSDPDNDDRVKNMRERKHALTKERDNIVPQILGTPAYKIADREKEKKRKSEEERMLTERRQKLKAERQELTTKKDERSSIQQDLIKRKEGLEIRIKGAENDPDLQMIHEKEVEAEKIKAEIEEREKKLGKPPLGREAYKKLLQEARGIAKEASDTEAFKKMAEAKTKGLSDDKLIEAIRKWKAEGAPAMKEFIKKELEELEKIKK
jgi:hypothetical protein